MANFYDTPNTLIQTPRYGKPQTQALDILTQRGLQNSNFGGIEQQARHEFTTRTQPSINERFQSLGGNSTLGSSGQQGANRLASSNLEAQLAGLKSQHGLKELQLGLEPQYDNFLQQEKEGLLSQGISGGANLAGQAGLNYLDKKWNAENLAAAETAKQGNKLGGQGSDVAQQVKDIGGGTLAGLAAKYATPAAAGTAAGLGAGYLANKAGVPEDASYGVGGAIGGAVTAGMAGLALAPVLAWGVGIGLTSYGLKKLYNYWSQANPGAENQLENKMAIMQLEGR